MRSRARLDRSDIDAALVTLPGWTLHGEQLRRAVAFDDFVEAFAFMSAMALVSQALDHHPDWRNVYGRVEIALWTHDQGGITALDLEWARRAEALLTKRAARS